MKRFKDFFKEETVSGDGGIGGLGFNSGNPAVDDDSIKGYLDTNVLAKDKQNGYLSKQLKDNQSKIAHKIGFKAFDPKELKKQK